MVLDEACNRKPKSSRSIIRARYISVFHLPLDVVIICWSRHRALYTSLREILLMIMTGSGGISATMSDSLNLSLVPIAPPGINPSLLISRRTALTRGLTIPKITVELAFIVTITLETRLSSDRP